MNLQDMFATFEKAGLKTLGQAKSALSAAGVDPSGLFVNHAELDKAMAALKPVAASAAAAITTEAETALDQLGPEIEHGFELLRDEILEALSRHMEPVHEALTKALASSPAPAAPPATT